MASSPGRAALCLALWILPGVSGAAPACDGDDGGLTLPEGFCALVVAEDLGAVRELAIAENGDVFAASKAGDHGVVALRDENGDGRADTVRRFGPPRGHQVRFARGHLYFAPTTSVVRWKWEPGRLEPAGEPEVVVRGFPNQGMHNVKGLVVRPDGALFVSIGAPSNSCQERDREDRSPGQDPCPELERQAGVFRYDADGRDQAHPGARFATGMRHSMALTAHPETGVLYAAINGRDQLGENWGYSAERNAELPAEEFVRLSEGDDYGWPYCYHDGLAGKKVLAPEYGGDGEKVGRCAAAARPRIAFPAHWAPMAIAFYTGTLFPERYRGGAFVAFRGSWNRAPLPQEGYRISFVPFRDGAPAGEHETFAIGAKSPTAIRFTGVAVGPDGSLYASADQSGKIWRILAESR